jgi:hypothetical protein
MNNLINTQPRKICHTLLFSVFYCDVDPNALTNLPVGAEFTTVYSPWPNGGWRAIRFQVVGPRRGDFQEIETRFLNSDEVAYFKDLLKASA